MKALKDRVLQGNETFLGGQAVSDESKMLAFIRKAVADYMSSEGCSCCQDVEGHKEHTKTLAKLLKVPKYSDKSGYNFSKFKSK